MLDALGMVDDQFADFKMPKLRALLSLLALYYAKGRLLQKELINLKDIASFMSRNNLADVYGDMSKQEKAHFKDLFTPAPEDVDNDDSEVEMANLFGMQTRKDLKNARLAPQGVRNEVYHRDHQDAEEHRELNPKLFDILTKLKTGNDLISDTQESSIHEINSRNFGNNASIKGINSHFDIGKSDHAQNRKGLFLEMRAMKHKVPWYEWRQIAQATHAMITEANIPDEDDDDDDDDASDVASQSDSEVESLEDGDN
jgi:hypothetical protein